MSKDATIEYINPKDLKPAEYNPRKIAESKLNQIRKSIIKFGFTQPLVVNNYKGRKNIIISGHQRTKVAIDLGMELIPVTYISVPLAKEKELNVRLNDGGEFDYGMLAEFDDSLLGDMGFEFLIEDEEGSKDNTPITTAAEGKSSTAMRSTSAAKNLTDIDYGSDAGKNQAKKGMRMTLGVYQLEMTNEAYFKWEDNLKAKFGYKHNAIEAHLLDLLGIAQIEEELSDE